MGWGALLQDKDRATRSFSNSSYQYVTIPYMHAYNHIQYYNNVTDPTLLQ